MDHVLCTLYESYIPTHSHTNTHHTNACLRCKEVMMSIGIKSTFHLLCHVWKRSKIKKSMNCAYRQEVQRTLNKQSRMHYHGHVHILPKLHHLSTFTYICWNIPDSVIGSMYRGLNYYCTGLVNCVVSIERHMGVLYWIARMQCAINVECHVRALPDSRHSLQKYCQHITVSKANAGRDY